MADLLRPADPIFAARVFLMHFGTYSLLLLAAAVNGGLLAVLLVSPGGRHAGSGWLAALVSALAVRMLPYVLGFAGAYDVHPWLTFAPFDFTLTCGPLLWLYVSTLATGVTPKRLAWHFAPGAVQLLYQLVCFALPLQAKWSWYTEVHLPTIEPWGVLLVLASLGAYALAAWRTYTRWQWWLDQNVSNRDESRLTWLRLILMAIAATGVLGAVMMAIHVAVRPLDYFARLPIIIALGSLAYLIGLLGYRYGRGAIPIRPITAPEIPDAPPSPLAQAPTSSVYPAQAEAWRHRIVAERWHHDPQLTLTSLASLFGTSPRTLSRVLNEGLGQSFNAFINGLRVDDAVKRLRAADAPDVLRVAMDVGFSSKASFNRAFRLHVGTTPTAIRGGASASATSQDPPIGRLAPPEANE